MDNMDLFTRTYTPSEFAAYCDAVIKVPEGFFSRKTAKKAPNLETQLRGLKKGNLERGLPNPNPTSKKCDHSHAPALPITAKSATDQPTLATDGGPDDKTDSLTKCHTAKFEQVKKYTEFAKGKQFVFFDLESDEHLRKVIEIYNAKITTKTGCQLDQILEQQQMKEVVEVVSDIVPKTPKNNIYNANSNDVSLGLRLVTGNAYCLERSLLTILLLAHWGIQTDLEVSSKHAWVSLKPAGIGMSDLIIDPSLGKTTRITMSEKLHEDITKIETKQLVKMATTS